MQSILPCIKINIFRINKKTGSKGIKHVNLHGSKIFEIKTNQGEIATMSNITQTLLYGYLLNKKGKTTSQINLYNPLTGEIDIFDTLDVNFKEISSIVYGHFKQQNK